MQHSVVSVLGLGLPFPFFRASGLKFVNPCPAEPGYTLPLQTVQIQISWLLQKPTDLDLHCLLFSI